MMKTTEAVRLAGVALAGAALGAGLALLFAPEEGRRLRRRLGRRVQREAGDVMRKAREAVADAGECLEEEVEAAYEKAARLVAR
jgi:gas vesicle protein